jgi:hypothetical protein
MPARNRRGARSSPPFPFPLLAEERQHDRRRRVGDRQGLRAQLLLNLQRLQAGRFLGEVSVDEVADTGFDRVRQLAQERLLDVQSFRLRAHRREIAVQLVSAVSMAVEAAEAPLAVEMLSAAVTVASAWPVTPRRKSKPRNRQFVRARARRNSLRHRAGPCRSPPSRMPCRQPPIRAVREGDREGFSRRVRDDARRVVVRRRHAAVRGVPTRSMKVRDRVRGFHVDREGRRFVAVRDRELELVVRTDREASGVVQLRGSGERVARWSSKAALASVYGRRRRQRRPSSAR